MGITFTSPEQDLFAETVGNSEKSPGITFEDSNGVEIDYSNRQIRFYKKDGSYNTALLTAQESDSGNTKGYEKGGVKYRTRFTINQEIQKDLHNRQEQARPKRSGQSI